MSDQYSIPKGSPWIMIELFDYNDFSKIKDITHWPETKYENGFDVDAIVINRRMFENNPQRYAEYDPRLINLVDDGYMILKHTTVQSRFLMAIHHEYVDLM